jgi:hypothetical protein
MSPKRKKAMEISQKLMENRRKNLANVQPVHYKDSETGPLTIV